MENTSTKQDLDEMLSGHCRTPFWPDSCGHGGYLFSFTCVEPVDGKIVEEKYDVYCFEQQSGQSFCLRFGEDGPDYRSPGTIENIILGHRLACYNTCLRLLKKVGDIKFIPHGSK